MSGKGAPKGNTYAVKREGDPMTAVMHIRCTPAEKAHWIRLAQASPHKTLTEFVKAPLPPVSGDRS